MVEPGAYLLIVDGNEVNRFGPAPVNGRDMQLKRIFYLLARNAFASLVSGRSVSALFARFTTLP